MAHTSHVTALAWNTHATLLASGSTDESIKLWSTLDTPHSVGPLSTLQAHTDPISSLAFSPDDSILASASHDGSLRLWHVPSAFCLKTIVDRPRAPLGHVAFTPDAHHVLVSSLDSHVKIWRYASSADLPDCRKTFGRGPAALAAIHAGQTNLPLPKLFTAVVPYDESTLQPGVVVPASHGPPQTTAVIAKRAQLMADTYLNTKYNLPSYFLPSDPTYILSPSEDGSIYIWHAQTRQPVNILRAHSGWSPSLSHFKFS